ncbi:MAG: transcriptional repressor NrdR [Chloroflexi bacterium]|jgi:transcriptional repressor NrdR|nr:transcriptional repressor NrdR [Chloroflexota bacterium]
MQYPHRSSKRLKALDAANSRESIRRRRAHLSCGTRLTTYGQAVAVVPVLVKTDGAREAFDRRKLKRGIWHARAKRPIAAQAVEQLAINVERCLQSSGQAEVSSRVAGDRVIRELKGFDPNAYVRHAIVYPKLDSLYNGRAEIDKLLAEQNASSAAVVDSQPAELPLITSN